jgi:hypothetical protein
MPDDRVTLRLRVGTEQAHYGGGLVDGAFLLKLFGDAATELLIRRDGDEGLFRAYASVDFGAGRRGRLPRNRGADRARWPNLPRCGSKRAR